MCPGQTQVLHPAQVLRSSQQNASLLSGSDVTLTPPSGGAWSHMGGSPDGNRPREECSVFSGLQVFSFSNSLLKLSSPFQGEGAGKGVLYMQSSPLCCPHLSVRLTFAPVFKIDVLSSKSKTFSVSALTEERPMLPRVDKGVSVSEEPEVGTSLLYTVKG